VQCTIAYLHDNGFRIACLTVDVSSCIDFEILYLCTQQWFPCNYFIYDVIMLLFYGTYTSRAVEPMMMMMISISAWAGIAGWSGDRIPVGA
jgi:hypothetical protein